MYRAFKESGRPVHILKFLRGCAIAPAVCLWVGAAKAEATLQLAPTIEPGAADDRLLAERSPSAPPPAPRVESGGPWYAEAYGGLLNPGNFTEIVFTTHRTNLTDKGLIGVGVGREAFDLGAGFSVDVGLNLGHRTSEGGVEIGAPITFVFDGFPWRNRLPTTLRLAVGPSYVSKISPTERRKDDDGGGSKLLNMFNPEVAIGWPTAPEWSAFFRLHHRSGIFRLINDVTGGSTYMVVGLRRDFSVDQFK